MKITGDYGAKYKLWAANPRVERLPRPCNLPPFSARKFDSYEAMNKWKEEYLLEIARQGGVKWMR